MHHAGAQPALPPWIEEAAAGEPFTLVAVAPHPDDAELGAGATLALHARMGWRVAILDLSRGELATNGTPARRQEEARRAAEILGLAGRYNLALPDGGLDALPEQVAALAAAFRALRPRLVLAPYGTDRHPDHEGAARLVHRAAFAAGLARFPLPLPPHPVERVASYFIHDTVPPSFVVDVSATYALKQAALDAYASQFGPGGTPTLLNRPAFREVLAARDRYFGSLIGATYGEGFVLRNRPPRLASLADLLPDASPAAAARPLGGGPS
ncbi:LmbE family protein [Thermaerobacter marianensis DSM 12885]|uniref:LmbE family protein n=1 Tax=Thermaerobacter marianensis (strain ATCC 700841 / DSM 12885 / JCM 10246 / 7p75a) TaxID=644966 RepID=E6SMB6_THEM7|nr:bacillithiol biosynthesis deacetylase BshB1 [Thermaerobacter marianensis]ADU51475.1 LmbE family protein [Thermaerobacter marianensis DSM 12885]